MVSKIGVCDVCAIVDNDYSTKEVFYCESCKKWICNPDLHSARRIEAAVKYWGMSLQQFLSKLSGR